MTDATTRVAARGGIRLRVPRYLGTDLLLVACGLLFVVPLVMLVVLAFRSGPPGAQTGWTLDGLRQGLNGAGFGVLAATMSYAAVVALLSTVIAVYFGWLFARTNVWLRAIIPLVMMAIIVTPSLFYAVAFDTLTGQKHGILNILVRTVIGSEAETGPLNAQSWTGMVVVASIRSAAFSFVLIAPAMMRVPRALEEAAQLGGASRAQILRTVIVPVVAPSIIGATLLAVIHTFEAFEIPLILGVPADITVLSTKVFGFLVSLEGANYTAAAALALPAVVILAGLVLWQEKALRGKGFETIGGKAGSSDRRALGRMRVVHSAVVGLFILVALVLPVLQVVLSTFAARPGAWTDLSTRNLDRMLAAESVRAAITNTWSLAVVGGLVTALFCVAVCWTMLRTSRRRGRLLARSAWLVTALPGILLGVAIFAAIMVVPSTRGLYGTVLLLFLALFIASAPVAIRAADGPVRQIAPELFEAARVNGSGRARAWVTSVLPLLGPAVLAAWFIAAVIISSNVAVPMLLATPQTTLLPVEAMSRYRSGDTGIASALIVLNMAIWIVLGSLLGLLSKAGARRRATRRSIGAASRATAE